MKENKDDSYLENSGWCTCCIVGYIVNAAVADKTPQVPLTKEQLHANATKRMVDHGTFDCERIIKRSLKDEESWKRKSPIETGVIKNGKMVFYVEGTAKNSFNATGKVGAICSYDVAAEHMTYSLVK